VKHAADVARIGKRVTCQKLRHSFAMHLLDPGYYIRTVQGLLGHKNVETTMIYTHVMSTPALAVRTPPTVSASIKRCSREPGVNRPAERPPGLATGFELPNVQWRNKLRQLCWNGRPSRRAL